MPAAHQTRIQRLRRLEALLPKPGTAPEHCLDGARLLAILGEAYGHGSPSAQRRALQRDLEALVKEARIEAVNPGGKPLRYRRCGDGEVVAPEAFRHVVAEQARKMATMYGDASDQRCPKLAPGMKATHSSALRMRR
jgi:hypothetical protein